MTTREEAARARRESVVTRSTEPGQRRAAAGIGGWFADRIVAHAQISLRDAGTDGSALTFDGYANTYDQPYEMYDLFGPYDETIDAGAGAKSLAQPGLDVPLVLQHQQLRRIARTTNSSLFLSEDDHGLRTLAPDLDPTDQDVAYIAPKLRSGLIDEMSFAFRIKVGEWSPDFTEYRIREYDIHRGDVAIVGYGANPNTTGGLRAVPDVRALLRESPDEEARAVLGDLLQRFPRRRARQPQEPLLPRVM